ncbi:hypothetical protein PRZ48_001935 [Zasmidium cellare]|uniref:Uncharacterized protein n=1 Tax=Zasmidium cellare TaxID=395010 RepID=A0ABR0F2L9_ZASCE|nr:hypothetical protein PRZ48_001935 [Zasmidium cellare]
MTTKIYSDEEFMEGWEELGRQLAEEAEWNPWGFTTWWDFEDAIQERSVEKVEDLFAQLQIADRPNAVEELAKRVGADQDQVAALTEMMRGVGIGEKGDSTSAAIPSSGEESGSKTNGTGKQAMESTASGDALAQDIKNALQKAPPESSHITDEDLNI